MIRDRDSTTLVVGRFYRVPCVRGLYCNRDGIWPVFLPGHTDAEIGFEDFHYHVDWRFFRVKEWRRTSHSHRYIPMKAAQFPLHIDHVRRTFQGPQPIIWQQRKCHTVDNQYPFDYSFKIRDILDPKYSGVRLGEDLICPHKRTSLKSVPVVDGCRTCPLHGLRFDAQGKVVCLTKAKPKRTFRQKAKQ